MRTRYQVALYHANGRLATVLDLTGTESLRYSRALNGTGVFLLNTPHYHPVMREKDALARVFRTHPVTGHLVEEAAFFLRSLDDVYTAYAGTVVSGVSLDYLLSGRLYVPDDDPLVAGGYSTKGLAAASLMAQIVEEQCVSPAVNTNRAIPGLSVQTVTADSSPYATLREEFKQQTVLDLLDRLAKAYAVDFWVEFSGVHPAGYFEYVFKAGRRGENRSKAAHPNGPYTYLSAALGNLTEPQLTLDAREEANVVFVLGKGANGHRLVYQQTGTGITDSPVARRECAVEASDVDSLDDLLTPAAATLAERRAVTTFTFRPQTGEPGARYGQDWDLGDTLTVGHRDHEFTMRVTKIEVTLHDGEQAIETEMELVV